MNYRKDSFAPTVLQIILFIVAGVFFFTAQQVYAHFRYGVMATMADLSYLETGAFLLLTAILGGLGGIVRFRDLVAGQKRRDERAAFVMSRLEQGGPIPEYSVYLRTFGITAKLGVSYRENTLLTAQVDRDDHRDLETLLAQSFETYQPLIALGKPGEHIGAGRLLTEEETWRDKIEVLLTNSSTIVMIPSHRDGTRWEVEWIISRNQQRKAFFLMPPTDKFTKTANLESWRIAAEILGPLGLHLPQYSERGMIFTINEDGHPRATRPLPKKVRPAKLRRLIKHLQHQPASVS
jgi:hypothetical protein